MRKVGFDSSFCIVEQVSLSSQAKVKAVGKPTAISEAKLGPVSTASVESGIYFLIISVCSSDVLASIPLEQIIRGTFGRNEKFSLKNVFICWAGIQIKAASTCSQANFKL